MGRLIDTLGGSKFLIGAGTVVAVMVIVLKTVFGVDRSGGHGHTH